MTKEELIKRLEECASGCDTEEDHGKADDALIEYINDPDIEQAYNRVHKWYA